MAVCGHYDCGGIRASVNGKDNGMLDWQVVPPCRVVFPPQD